MVLMSLAQVLILLCGDVYLYLSHGEWKKEIAIHIWRRENDWWIWYHTFMYILNVLISMHTHTPHLLGVLSQPGDGLRLLNVLAQVKEKE